MGPMQAPPGSLVGHRYVLLDLLGEGGMGQVFRARDRLTGQIVALKRVRFDSSWNSEEEELSSTQSVGIPALRGQSLTESLAVRSELPLRLLLAQEFRTLVGLRHPHIISVLDYGFDDEQQPFFTMELLDGASDLLQAGKRLGHRDKLRLLDQTLSALQYLHRRGILHRDLKPRNVLVCEAPEGAQVKVLDFGLAVARTDAAPSGVLLGTLLYMAPELFQDQPARVASDLYAVGVMAYELLVGRHPFSHHLDAASLIRAIGEESANLSPLLEWPELAALIGSLLDKDPAKRPASADLVAQSLRAQDGVSQPEESTRVRDSFLLAARFVGRSKELRTLTDAVDAARAGHGGAWLVGGESGVGKSRLLDEVRTHALVEGVRVLRGQATQERASGLDVFRELIRPLCLTVNLSTQEASVLKGVVPDLPVLIGRTIPDGPSLDPQAARRLLFDTIVSLLMRATDPLLVILEDLHWVDSDTCALLSTLIGLLGQRRMLVLGSYRDDEKRDLPARLLGVSVLPLKRLDPVEVTELTVSILGESAERPDLQALLQQETEGNTFFVIEVMRALAEEAGGLRAVAERTLPRRVVTGGMEAVVRRRLRRVPGPALLFLRAAAVAGRELDLTVLSAIDSRIDRWLQLCAEAAIIEIDEARWRFTHSKIREGVLAELTESERISFHRQLAETIEQVYPNSDVHAAVLGFHFERAHDPTRAAESLLRAGIVALRNGALYEAATHLQTAFTLQEQIAAPKVAQAATLRKLARALYGLGQNEECIHAVKRAMALVGKPIPNTPLGRQRAIWGEVLTEFRSRLVGPPLLASTEQRELKQEQLNLVIGTGDSLFVSKGELDVALYVMLCGLHAAEQLHDLRHQVTYFSSLGYTASLFPFTPLCRYYLDRAQGLAQTLSTEQPLSGYHSYSGLFAHSEARWADAERAYLSAVRFGIVTEDLSQEALMESLLTALYMDRNDLLQVEHHATRIQVIGKQIGNRQLEAAGAGWRAIVAMSKGELQSAYRTLYDAMILMEESSSRPHKLTLNGGLALCALRMGELSVAQEQCDRALRRMERGLVPAPSFRIGYSALLAATIGLWDRSTGTSTESSAERRVWAALRQMVHFSVVFPIGRPWALLGLGRFLSKKGMHWLGQRFTKQALALAARMDVPLQQQAGIELLP